MHIVNVRNVCEALPATLRVLHSCGTYESSRAGDVLVAPYPIVTQTERPRERVLFSATRDANPFFHLAEAMWMLAGRNDAKFLNNFVHDFGDRYAEPDGRIHDAYGRRWRHSFGYDQIEECVSRLTMDPLDRQCVITMWDPRQEFDNDFKGVGLKGRPCNTNIYLRVRRGESLDMTVCCRSNDMIYGAHGANAVHFSVLQEYLAARIDVDVGRMYQISNNAHIYMNMMAQLKLRVPINMELYDSLIDNRYADLRATALPMFDEPCLIDQDVNLFMNRYSYPANEFTLISNGYHNVWFADVLTQAMRAHSFYKQKRYNEALTSAGFIASSDWRIACTEWIQRRAK